ncbi:MAG: DUF362 domain-containing protein [Candidatus Deferrimicrobiaceae bacterium]
MTLRDDSRKKVDWGRREFLLGSLGWGIAASGSLSVLGGCTKRDWRADTFIAKVHSYETDIVSALRKGLRELAVGAEETRGKRILLKPNLIEPHAGAGHINTHPGVVRAAAEAFLRLGASEVLVGEGPGHSRDSVLVLEESGLGDVLAGERIPFVDLNYESGYAAKNLGRQSRLATLTLPAAILRADWVVSVAKMKTHHWTGVTLSMKNLFGLMPGMYYGWPKNVLHWEGVDRCIFDINATVKPHFAIVDGIVGMEGDGPIMGAPHHAGVIVMGRNLPALDATCARIMGIDPYKVVHLAAASDRLGTIRETDIRQRGENIASVRTDFALMEKIHAQRGLRLR